jgi:hypothetical protein
LLSQTTPVNAPVLDQRTREPRVQAQLDAVLRHHLERDPLPAVGIEGGREDDRMRLGLGVEVERAPARPALQGRRPAAPFVLARKLREAARSQALDQIEADAAHRDLVQPRIPHVVEHQHHATGREAAEVVVALEQHGRGAVARRGDGRRHASRAAADDDHVGARDHLDVAGRLANRCRCRSHVKSSWGKQRRQGDRDQT